MTATLFHGGRIMVDGDVSAEALVARDGRVVAVGRAADLRREHPDAERVDLKAGLMTPGWHDAHVHFTWWAIQMDQIDLRDALTLDAALARIETYAARLPASAWVLGGRFDKNRWGRWPTAIERDASGAPTGILKENANQLAEAVVPPPTMDETYAAIERGQREAHRRGLTAIEDLESATALSAFQRRRDRGDLRLRVAMGIPHANLDAALALGLRTGLGDEWLRVGHLKIFTDGALGSQTAALEEPYAGSDDRGLLTIEPDRLNADVARAAAAGIAVAIHAIGDRAVRVALDAIEPTRSAYPSLRQRVEHVQLVRREDIARFGALDVIASMQPIHATSDRDLVDRYWGPDRATRAYPWRHLLDRGGRLAFGSDAPVEPIDPLLGMHAAVARKRPSDRDRWHPQQALELDEAIAGYTSGAAYAMSAESERGTLGVGMRCDATIVERDLATTPVDEWPTVRVTGTVVDGTVVYAAGLG